MRWIGFGWGLLAVACARSAPPESAVDPSPSELNRPTLGAPDSVAVPPDIYGAVCGGAPTPFADVVMPLAERMQRKKVWYNSEDLSDCSGIFHRVLDSFANQCRMEPRPNATDNRTSRQIGRWYLDAGLLTVVSDPVAQQDLIHPGSVLFFGPDGVDYHRLDPTDAMERIRHLGVVVETTRTEAGELQSYRMFHGRRSNTYASITNWHRVTSSPPFGNGSDKIIAVTPLATPLGRTHLERLGVPPVQGELRLACGDEIRTASEVVVPAAESLRGKTVRVRWKSDADKVRVFTVLMEQAQKSCANVVIPPPEASTGHVRLAQWYVAEGHFETVDDADQRGAWIVPGSVMFYGPSTVDYRGMDPEDLLGHIDHMGVVVSVERDEAGEVVGYTVFQAPPEGAFEAQFVSGNPRGATEPFGLEGRVWLGVAPISAR